MGENMQTQVSRPRAFIAVVVGLTLFALLITQRGASSNLGEPAPAMVVDIPADVDRRLDARAVQALIDSRMPGARIDRISARALLSDVRTVERQSGYPLSGHDRGPVWIVRAHGNFVGRFVPPGHAPVVANTGYFLVDDADGSILSMGMP
jgi:hypothetical protein